VADGEPADTAVRLRRYTSSTNGEAMRVVTIAINTMIVNSVGVMMPRSRPMLRI
jgi:hypothetical protein